MNETNKANLELNGMIDRKGRKTFNGVWFVSGVGPQGSPSRGKLLNSLQLSSPAARDEELE